MSPEFKLSRLVLIGLLASGLAGAASSWIGLETRPFHARPFHMKTGLTISELVKSNPDRLIVNYYAVYAELGDVLDGDVVVVPPGHPLDALNAAGIANLRFDIETYVSELSIEALDSLGTEGVKSGIYWQPGRIEYEYFIIPGSEPLRLMMDGDTLIFLSEEALAGIKR